MTALLAIFAFVLGLAAAAKDLIQSLARSVASVPGSGFIGEFILSESGRVNPEQGFRLAWAAGVIVAAMVVLGTPPKAAAHHQCSSTTSSVCVSDGQCGMWCQVWEGCNWGVCHNPGEDDSYCQCS